ncbi:MAG: radical SAM protein, partial [Bauldia sp.]
MRADLIARYGEQRLPRYTSYPTAPHFHAAVGAATYAEWLGTVPETSVGSIYVHIPFCRRMCWYCGCNTSVTRRDAPIVAYANMLLAEIDLVASRLGRRMPVAHIHFGGGTPTIMSPRAFLDMMNALRRSFAVREDAEIAV